MPTLYKPSWKWRYDYQKHGPKPSSAHQQGVSNLQIAICCFDIYIYLYPYKVVLQNSEHSWFYGDYYSSMANLIRHFTINWSFRQHPQNLSQLLFPVLLVNVGFITWIIPYMKIDEFMWVISWWWQWVDFNYPQKMGCIPYQYCWWLVPSNH